MPSSEAIVGTFALLGAVTGSLVTQAGSMRIDARRRRDEARDARRATIASFLASARTCVQNVAAAHGAQDMAREADASWWPGNRKWLGDRALRLIDTAMFDGLSELVALRLGVDRLRMTWGQHEVVERAQEAVDRIHEAAESAVQDDADTLRRDVRYINERLDALASLAYGAGD